MLNIEDGVLPAPGKVYKKVQEYFKKKNQDMTLPPKLNTPTEGIGACFGSNSSVGSKGKRNPSRPTPDIEEEDPSEGGSWKPLTTGSNKFNSEAYDKCSQNLSQRMSLPTPNSLKALERSGNRPIEVAADQRVFENPPRQFEPVRKSCHTPFTKISGSFKIAGSESGEESNCKVKFNNLNAHSKHSNPAL